MPDVLKNTVAAVPYLLLDENGAASLIGSRCEACGAIIPGRRNVCASCTARDRMQPVRLAERGKLYTYSIVHRSFPGVKTPFVTAVVDLDGGGTLKGTLLDVVPDPATIKFDMPVKVVFRDTGQKTKDGQSFLSYFFIPDLGGA